MTPHLPLKGRLLLLPVPLSPEGGAMDLPGRTLDALRTLRHFVVENAKTARRVLKACGHPLPLASLHMAVLDAHTPEQDVPALLAPLAAGYDLGLMSEAGCPAVADPGARLVRLVHAQNGTVLPLGGPSSLLLALMASGLEGQRFAFHGYLPVEAHARRSRILQLEHRSRQEQETQLLIETPYRNRVLWTALLESLAPETLLCLGLALSTPEQEVHTRTVGEWRRHPEKIILERRPCVFLFLAQC